MPTGDERKAAALGLSGLNVAINAGLTDTQIQNATGVSNLQAVIRALAIIAGTAQNALEQAARAIGFAANGGVITDAIVQGWTGATTARATFTGYDSALPSNTISYLP